MQFEINNKTWTIIEIEKEWLVNKYNEEHEEKTTFVFGLCEYPTQTIFINKDMHEDQKRSTLKHELMHCWLWCNGIVQFELSEEDVCNLVSASNHFINEAVKIYEEAKEEEKIKESEALKATEIINELTLTKTY